MESTCPNKDLYPNHLKELSKLKKPPNFKTDRRLGKTVHKEDRHTTNTHMDRMSSPSGRGKGKSGRGPSAHSPEWQGERKQCQAQGRARRGRDTRAPPGGVPNCIGTLRNRQFRIQLNVQSPYDAAAPILGICPREMSTYSYTKATRKCSQQLYL